MPELPDIELYLSSLRTHVGGRTIERIRPFNPFIVRTAEPPIASAQGKRVEEIGRIGKRIVLHLEDDLHLVIHLMIAGRLRWDAGKRELRMGGKIAHCAFTFPEGTLTLTEASSHKRASISLYAGKEALRHLDPGGLDVRTEGLEAFRERLVAQNRTLKRALTNPHTFDGIGNAYSDEILHAARLSPVRLTQSLGDGEIERLWEAIRRVLASWTERLQKEFAGRFPGPGDVTAFRPDFAVHGKFGKPCPDCGKPVQRIRYAENETNYCAQCQNEGRMLADRGLSRLLKSDWPRTLEEMLGER